MVSKYFEMRTSKPELMQEVDELIKTLEGKKVLIYGTGEVFKFLEKRFNLKDKLNIIGISDKKFNNDDAETYCGYRVVKTAHIPYEDFDIILIADEDIKSIKELLEYDLWIDKDKIQMIFKEDIKDEIDNYNFLMKNKFDKTLPNLLKKVKNKKVILYGAGAFLELIKKYFDISSLNVIGISDKRFSSSGEQSEFLGYKTIPPEQIIEINPDYVLVATKYYIRIIEDLHDNLLKNSKIKIKPLVEKSFMTLFKEIQELP